ncbi:MAG TPA: hypothetical protein VFP98_06080 [Candidatus Polarisedimenticolia bacterium]|nr:hypothetical protein [Candidatus Polarisedimenticolia bacterium]
MSDHPLTELFQGLAERNFSKVGLKEPEVPHYVAGMLAEFVHIDRLYKIRNARGERIEDVGEMLLESDIRHRASSLERERSVRKHIGDFTLFFTGMFPEHIHSRRNWWRLDRWLDWIETGRESYRIVGQFDLGPYAEEAPLYRRMSEHFDFMVVALNFVRDDLARMRDSRYELTRDILSE